MKIEQRLNKVLNSLTNEEDKALVKRAFEIANKAHEGQKRESGAPYIIHPMEVAIIMTKIKMNANTIAAALLHDVVDDTDISIAEIEKQFGKEIAFLVEGVSKLGRIEYSGIERHAENLRKMLLATAQDVRVMLIKFADRIHNMRTLNALPKHKQKRIALETMEIYAPIASRLGVYELARQLEDLAFQYIYPQDYDYVKTESAEKLKATEKYFKKTVPVLKKTLKKEGVVPKKITTRTKHYYSLWQKLKRKDYNWEQVYDLIAVRIIVSNIENCYKTLGIIHKLWKPLPGRIKDYIALPRPNGYQSLHTTVFGPEGKQIEIQIRTPQMHEHAEYGIASHWRYKSAKDDKRGGKQMQKTFEWVKRLQEWQKETSNTEDFLENLKIDVFSDRIFVFTPDGDVIDLPEGSTPVDFAYHIHSDIGNKCTGALVNAKITTLNTELKNGDVVEIITSKNKKPSAAWLTFVKTNGARSHIRKWFREQNEDENKTSGLQLINEALKELEGKSWEAVSSARKQSLLKRFGFKTESQLLAAVGQGDISINRIINNLAEALPRATDETEQKITKPAPRTEEVVIAGTGGLKTKMAQCCKPKTPERISAYITVDKGASIHRHGCENLKVTKREDKILPAYWAGQTTLVPVKLELRAQDKVGMLQEISRDIAALGINITFISSVSKKEDAAGANYVILEIDLELKDFSQLKKLVDKLKVIDGVIEIKRKI